MTELLTFDFMQRALLAALLVGTRRPAWSGSSSSSAGCPSSATAWGTSPWPASPSACVTGAAPVLDRPRRRRRRGRRHRAAPGPRAHQRRRRPGRDLLRRHRRRRRHHQQVARRHAGQPHDVPLRRDHSRPAAATSASSPRSPSLVVVTTWALRPRLFAVANDEEYARAVGMPVLPLNIMLAVLTAVTVVVAMRVVGLLLISALMIVPNAAAQLLAPQLPLSDALRCGHRRRLVASVGGVAPPSTPTPRPGAPSSCSPSPSSSLTRGHRTGLRGRLRARRHRGGRARTRTSTASSAATRRCARRPRRLPPRRPPARPARGPLRRARRSTPTTTRHPSRAAPTGRARRREAMSRLTEHGPARRPGSRRRWPSCSDGTDDFTSAQDLHARLRERGQTVGLATVYRTLQSMADAGEVDVLRTDDGEAVYRACSHRHHHHHLVCRACGRTVEVEGPAVERWADRSRRARLQRRHATPWRSSAPAPTARADGSLTPRCAPRGVRPRSGARLLSTVSGGAVARRASTAPP